MEAQIRTLIQEGAAWQGWKGPGQLPPAPAPIRPSGWVCASHFLEAACLKNHINEEENLKHPTKLWAACLGLACCQPTMC